MKTKSCGTCEFWDRENADTENDITSAWCLWLSENQDCCPKSLSSNVMEIDDGQDCPVHKERQDAK